MTTDRHPGQLALFPAPAPDRPAECPGCAADPGPGPLGLCAGCLRWLAEHPGITAP